MSSRGAWWVVAAAIAIGIGCGGKLDLSDRGAPGDDNASPGRGGGSSGSSDDGQVGKDDPWSPPTKTPGKPPSGKKDPTEAELGDRSACPAKGSFDASAYTFLEQAYRAPPQRSAVCTDAEIAILEAGVASTADTFNFARSGLSPACRSCIFTTSTDASWGPVVWMSDGTMGTFSNVGACHASVNASTACGKAVQLHAFCTRPACMDCPSSMTGACLSKSTSTVCAETYDAMVAACPNLGASTQVCGPVSLARMTGNVVADARYFCASGP